MVSDDHSIVPIPDSELDRRGKGNNPILQRMAKDLLAQSEDELADDSHIHFKCPNLEKAIREKLKKTADPITRKGMASLKSLSGEGVKEEEAKITELSGLERATNLKHLYLSHNNISDLTPLVNLTNLTDLWLRDNNISDITPLANLTNLTELVLQDDQITDLTPLTKLTNLRTLTLNQMPAGTPLTRGLHLLLNQFEEQKAMLKKALPNCKICFD